MERFSAFRQLLEIPIFQRLRERIEETPNVSPFKCIMFGLTPFMKHAGDQTIRANANVHRANEQIMGFSVVDLCLFVGGDAGVLLMPFRHEFPNRPRNKLGQVTVDVAGVLPVEFDVSHERQIVTDQNCSTGNNTSGEHLVVTVSESEDPAIILSLGFSLRMYLHEPEIPVPFVGQRMGLVSDAKVGPFEGGLHGGDQLVVRNRMPAWCGMRGLHFADVFEVHMRGATMQDEVGAFACCGW